MSRIRSIKPEFWTNEQIVECSPIARLLFVGMWNFCDDGGNHPASSKTLKMEIFPGDDFSVNKISGLVSELILQGLLVEYEAGNKQYWHVTGWHHQKIEKPNKKYPTPESGIIRRPFADHSPKDTLLLADQTPEDVDVDIDVSSLEGSKKACDEKPIFNNHSAQRLRECFFDKSADIERLFPQINTELELEKMAAYYGQKTIGADVWLVVMKWLEKVKPSTQTSADYMTAEKVRTLTDLKMFPIDSRPNILKGLPVETVDFIMKEIRVERGVVY